MGTGQLAWSLVGASLVAMLVPMGEASAQQPQRQAEESEPALLWQPLLDLPDSPGVAGAFVGLSGGALVVAGGTNFAEPVWENDKEWHDKIHVLSRKNHRHEWHDGGKLPRPLAGGASVTLSDGLLCIGGCDNGKVYSDVFLLSWDPGSEQLTKVDFPPLPNPCCYGQAAVVGQLVYLVGGQSGLGLESAHAEVWVLDLADRDKGADFAWHRKDDFAGGPRSFHAVVAQFSRGEKCLYVMGGRREENGKVVFLNDAWRHNRMGIWSRRADMPRAAAAAPAVPVGRDAIYVLGGDDGALFDQTDRLREKHPGFSREALVYITVEDRWESAGEMPVSQLATQGVLWEGKIIVASGETQPRVRSPKVWSVRVRSQERAR